MIYSSGTTASTDNRGTITVVPNQKYWAKFEILRNDLGHSHEYVVDVIVGGTSLGRCNPDGGDYDCSFYDCSSEQQSVVVSSATAELGVNIKLTGHSRDCDCDTATWACSKEGTVGGRTAVTAVGRVTLVPTTGKPRDSPSPTHTFNRFGARRQVI